MSATSKSVTNASVGRAMKSLVGDMLTYCDFLAVRERTAVGNDARSGRDAADDRSVRRLGQNAHVRGVIGTAGHDADGRFGSAGKRRAWNLRAADGRERDVGVNRHAG